MIVSKIVSREPLSFVTLADAKGQLNIIDDDDSFDSHIEILIATAMELAEGGTNRALSLVNVISSVRLVNCNSFYLPYGEIESITEITQNGEPVNYTFNVIAQRVTISDTITGEIELMVSYTAGYATPNDVPTPVKMGALVVISDLYENRESTVAGSISDLPLAAKVLFGSYRLEYV